MTDGMVIIDASIAIKAILPNPLQSHCWALVQTFAELQPVAPVLWAYETTSAISKAVHFEQITEEEGFQALQKIDLLGIRLFVPDVEQNHDAFRWTLRLKRAAAYDSFYLALAQELKCDFWTADKRLFNAVNGEQRDWMHWIEEITPSNN